MTRKRVHRTQKPPSVISCTFAYETTGVKLDVLFVYTVYIKVSDRRDFVLVNVLNIENK